MARVTTFTYEGPICMMYVTDCRRYVMGYKGKPDWSSEYTRRSRVVKATGGPVTWAYGSHVCLLYTIDDFIAETGLKSLRSDIELWKTNCPHLAIDCIIMVVGPQA